MWEWLSVLVVLASGWTQRSAIQSRVHDHEFDRVSVQSSECSLEVKLWFTAPESGYKDRSPRRNSYLFRARVKLDDGRQVTSELFRTSKPGRKLQTWTHDTSAEGCWAKQKPALRSVVVNGCRGRRCVVPELE
ncbi:MAG: hypothetical protein HS104_20155 [Polyangiaceae bacterium]|nr:hypothetical protein [Polyangiaceae bacterium]MCE7894841.1 hypothetical protein [Sorangiineae bacterium PRO1]MCL4752576.1 hypothetical protein [Myxococcales bacterium]